MIRIVISILTLFSFFGYASPSGDVSVGIGIGSLYSDNICNESFYACGESAVTYELFSELDIDPYSLRANYFRFSPLSADGYAVRDEKKITVSALSIVPYYRFDLSESINLKLGAGISLWHDQKFGSYFGESVVQSIIIEKSMSTLDLGISFKIDFYPNFYKSSTDIFVFGVQLHQKISSYSLVNNGIDSSILSKSFDRYIEQKEIILYYSDGSSEVLDQQLLYDFNDGDYFVVYGYRTYSEDIIISIDRARNVESILKSKYPNSKIDVVNMSAYQPLSDSYDNRGIDQERRVKVKVFKVASE